MYCYNLRLLENIHTLLGKGKQELSEILYGDVFTLGRHVKLNGRITVNELVSVCNRLHISVTHFFTTAPDVQVLGTRKDYVIPAEMFREITFDHTRLNTLYGRQMITNIQTTKDFSRIMGISPPSLLYVLRGERKMKVDLLLRICNKLGLNLGYFIKDENASFPANDQSGVEKELVHPEYLAWAGQQETSQRRAQPLPVNEGCKLADPEVRYMPRRREWKYSPELFRHFPEIKGVSMQEVLRSIGNTRTASYCKSENLHVFELVNICNTYCLSARYFLTREDTRIYGKEYYDTEDFTPIRFRPERIQMLCGEKSVLKILQKDWMEQMGISASKFYGWFRPEESTLCMKDLIRICNQYHVSPFFFIEDKNRVKEPESTNLEEMLMEECALLKEEVDKLKKENRELKGKP